jgi:hypothetical protein
MRPKNGKGSNLNGGYPFGDSDTSFAKTEKIRQKSSIKAPYRQEGRIGRCRGALPGPQSMKAGQRFKGIAAPAESNYRPRLCEPPPPPPLPLRAW